MKILALDLGTKTGYAYNHGTTMIAGTLKLATDAEITAQAKLRMDRRLDCRAARLYNWLWTTIATERPHVVLFEDVQFTTFTAPVQLWSTYRGVLWSVLHQYPNTIPECVPVTTLKRTTTRHGSADKDEMKFHVVKIFGERLKQDGKNLLDSRGVMLDDNAIDALSLWNWANTHLLRTPV